MKYSISLLRIFLFNILLTSYFSSSSIKIIYDFESSSRECQSFNNNI